MAIKLIIQFEVFIIFLLVVAIIKRKLIDGIKSTSQFIEIIKDRFNILIQQYTKLRQ